MKKILCFLFLTTTASLFSITEDPRAYAYFIPRKVQEHTLTSFSIRKSLVRIEDGSHFKVSSSDTNTLREWRPGDRLLISPNKTFLSFHPYKIRNITLGNFVLASLHLGPSIDNPLTKQIEAIDYRNLLLLLNDGFYWSLPNKCADKLRNWNEFDYIIIGSNEKGSYPYILINVTLNEYAEARLDLDKP